MALHDPIADALRGSDPNTGGGPLRDRFHQMRQGGRENSVFRQKSDRLQEKSVSDLLASRGAPMTAQNAADARAYLMGGDLVQFGQGDTAGDIAGEAIAAEGQRTGVQSAAPVIDNSNPPVSAVGPDVAPIADTNIPVLDDGAGLSPGALAALIGVARLMAPDGVTPTPSALKAQQELALAGRGIDGEIVDPLALPPPAQEVATRPTNTPGRDGTVVGVNPGQSDNLLPAPPGGDVIDAQVIDETPPVRRRPSTQPQFNVDPATAPIDVQQDIAAPNAASAPLPADNLPTRPATDPPGGQDLGTNASGQPMRRADGQLWVGQADGSWVAVQTNNPTVNAPNVEGSVRRAISGAARAAF